MNKAIFSESGWKAEVEILEDNSNEQWERFKLKVIRTLRKSPIFITPEDGYIFEVCADKKYRAYVDWRLETTANE